jgi:hypothetical protein
MPTPYSYSTWWLLMTVQRSAPATGRHQQLSADTHSAGTATFRRSHLASCTVHPTPRHATPRHATPHTQPHPSHPLGWQNVTLQVSPGVHVQCTPRHATPRHTPHAQPHPSHPLGWQHVTLQVSPGVHVQCTPPPPPHTHPGWLYTNAMSHVRLLHGVFMAPA